MNYYKNVKPFEKYSNKTTFTKYPVFNINVEKVATKLGKGKYGKINPRMTAIKDIGTNEGRKLLKESKRSLG